MEVNESWDANLHPTKIWDKITTLIIKTLEDKNA